MICPSFMPTKYTHTKFNMAAKNHVTPQNLSLGTPNLNPGSKKSKWPPNSTWPPKKSCDTSKFTAQDPES